jgi:hypothetical protein
MIKSFFRSLETQRVNYLLISGQAAVLYGAAHFSEDIDLWVEPTVDNIKSFAEVLRIHSARYYKLTPKLEPNALNAGHGFHFTLPEENGPEVYIDIMGRPPRVRDFPFAAAQSVLMDSEWGALRTVGIKDLVELKKTQRLQDYPVISRLALRYLEERAPEQTDLLWGLANLFTLDAAEELFARYPNAAEVQGDETATPLIRFGAALRRGEQNPELEKEATQLMSTRMAELQQRDRLYWRDIIQQLRQLRANGGLVPEGTVV